MRGEAGTGVSFDPDHHHLDLLSRLRVSAEARMRTWMRVKFELQDARALVGGDSDLREAQADPLDIRDAYVEFGKEEGAFWNLRAGRQTLAFGDERLVGADTYWCNRGRRFDGVRATFKPRGWQWDIFSGTETPFDLDGVDPLQSHDRLSGVYGSWTRASAHLRIEPYFLITSTHKPLYPSGTPETFDGRTPGVRVVIDVLARSSVTSETAWQFGEAGGRQVRAWAGSWSITQRINSRETTPALSLGYAYASGDQGATTGTIGTFNDLYPAGFNTCGFVTPFAWRNVKDLFTTAEWKPAHRWRFASEIHGFWVANTHDGVYLDEDAYFLRNASGSDPRLGSLINAVVQYKQSSHWDVGGGYGRFLAGPYLREGDHGASGNNAFLAWTLVL